MTRTPLAPLLALALAAPALAQPAPEAFRKVNRQWAEGQARSMLIVDEVSGFVSLTRLDLTGAAPPLLREGRLTDAERAELQALAGAVAALPDDESGGLDATSYVLELASGTARYLVPAPGGATALGLRPLDGVLDRLAARLSLATTSAPGLHHLRRVRDAAPDRVRDVIEVHGDGTVEVRLHRGLAVRILRGKLEAAERERLIEAVRAVDLASLAHDPAADYPRVRLDLTPTLLGDPLSRTLGLAATAVRLRPLHLALDAVARRLRSAASATGYERIYRHTFGQDRIEVEAARARVGSWGEWRDLTADEVAALDAAVAALDLRTLPTGPLSGWDRGYEVRLKDGTTRGLNRRRAEQEAELTALEAVLDAIVRRLSPSTATTSATETPGLTGALRGE